MNKLFALASMSALTGLVLTISAIGCSSSTSDTPAGDVPDSGTDATKTKTAPPPGDDDTEAGPGTCPTTDAIDPTTLNWKPATAPQEGKCTGDDVTAMDTYLKSSTTITNAQFEDFVKTRSQTCHDCVFTDANGATWGPLPETSGTISEINIGSCFSIVSGKDACGKAIQNEFDCELQACSACDSTATTACRTKAQTGACKAILAAEQTGCAGADQTALNNDCGSFLKSITVQCVGLPDGGDGGP